MMLYSSTSDIILKCFYEVYNRLGYGFLETVYKNALFQELTNNGLKCELEKGIHVFYKEYIVGEYYADIVVENNIILELKTIEAIGPAQEAQLINYLKATGIELGFLLNFGPKAEFRRKIMTKPYVKDNRKDKDLGNDNDIDSKGPRHCN